MNGHTHPTRRTLVKGAAWAAPAVALAAHAPMVAASPCQVQWTTTSYMDPGKNVSDRDKDVFVCPGIDCGQLSCGDVALDGWHHNKIPQIRVVVGSLVEVKNVKVTVFAASANIMSFSTTYSALVSPAGGATPEAYKQVTITNLPAPVRIDDKTWEWNLGTIPAESSAGFNFSLNMVEGNTERLAVSMKVTGVIG